MILRKSTEKVFEEVHYISNLLDEEWFEWQLTVAFLKSDNVPLKCMWDEMINKVWKMLNALTVSNLQCLWLS